MSKVNKRKHVMNESLWDDFELPNKNQSIVKVLKSKGNNLHEIITPTGEEYLVSMPTKFRKNIWVKRGDYIVVEPIPEGDKVKAEIVKIMNKDSIKYYKGNNAWPKEFEDSKEVEDNKTVECDDDDCDLFVNTNRRPVTSCEMSDSDSDVDISPSDDSDDEASNTENCPKDTANITK